MPQPSLPYDEKPASTAPVGDSSGGVAYRVSPQFFSRQLGRPLTLLLGAVACSALLQAHAAAAQDSAAPASPPSVSETESVQYLAQATDEQSEDVARPPQAAEKNAEPDAVAEDQKQSELDDYEASEQISEDLSVSFPVDI